MVTGLNSRESEERCDRLPRESSRANEVTMEQVERCELDAIEGPSLGRLQLQTMLQRASTDMSRINAEDDALLATATAAMQSRNAMADDCRAHLAVLHAELDEAFYDRPSDCALRAAESIYLVIDITETELEQIESDALAVLATMTKRCTANAARAVQLQAHTAELLCPRGGHEHAERDRVRGRTFICFVRQVSAQEEGRNRETGRETAVQPRQLGGVA